ncbi:MAG: FG-GAP repeat protein, partial [Deltaproteobacteria bacterium]|nr:FG-GAP repeat protein [Deltaproteobacteria bacterium]
MNLKKIIVPVLFVLLSGFSLMTVSCGEPERFDLSGDGGITDENPSESPDEGDAGDEGTATDSDGDGVADESDNCPGDANADQTDTDSDGDGNVCDDDNDGDGVADTSDAFPDDSTELSDSDLDGVGDNSDNCPSVSNADQSDIDGDGMGDVCDDDADGDGIADESDNCPDNSNSDQADLDDDETGDPCDDDADGDGYTADEGDCDDADSALNPGATETEDGIDNDCDEIVDNHLSSTDDDGDGYSEDDGDCNDADSALNPGATEAEDGIDNDCDGLVDNHTDSYDDDDDGITENDGDCDDDAASIYPGAAEIFDLADSDCNGAADENFGLSGSSSLIDGQNSGDQFGRAVTIVGDVNGDGLDDFAVAAPYADDGADSNVGKTYLFYGTDPFSGSLDVSEADVTFVGEAANDYSGTSVSTAGDVNADGFADFLIGAYKNDGSGTDQGRVYLVYGSDALSGSSDLASTADITITGGNNYDYFGFHVARGGDINGDGYEDFLVGAYGNDDGGNSSGKVYVFYGSDSLSGTLTASDAHATFTGENVGDVAGKTVAPAGDVDGDGYDDFLIAAPSYDHNSDSSAGKVYLVYGQDPDGDAPLTGDIDLSSVGASVDGASFIGEDAGDNLGLSLVGVGNVSGSAYDDFVLGAYKSDTGGSDSGEVYLFT